MRLAILLLLASTLCFAGSWSGFLVDSNCYASEQSNVNKDSSTVDRDMGMEVRYCSPNADTKIFAVVLPDWDSLKLDSAGNAMAAELVRRTSKQRLFAVTVTGDLNHDTVKVDSLSANR